VRIDGGFAIEWAFAWHEGYTLYSNVWQDDRRTDDFQDWSWDRNGSRWGVTNVG